jgi:hypothetical protein
MDEKGTLHHYLRVRRDSLRGKLDGLSEYDVRRPLTPTGTNLLGLVKHLASVELDYFGVVFDRPSGRRLPWLEEGASPDADLWATTDESREDILELHRFAAAHSDATIEALPADAAGMVPWWPEERRHVTLHQILVHMVAERAHLWVTRTSCASSSTATPDGVRAIQTSQCAVLKSGPGTVPPSKLRRDRHEHPGRSCAGSGICPRLAGLPTVPCSRRASLPWLRWPAGPLRPGQPPCRARARHADRRLPPGLPREGRSSPRRVSRGQPRTVQSALRGPDGFPWRRAP